MVVIELVYRKGSHAGSTTMGMGISGANAKAASASEKRIPIWKQRQMAGLPPKLPRFSHFVPIEPWTVKKIKPRRIRVMPK